MLNFKVLYIYKALFGWFWIEILKVEWILSHLNGYWNQFDKFQYIPTSIDLKFECRSIWKFGPLEPRKPSDLILHMVHKCAADEETSMGTLPSATLGYCIEDRNEQVGTIEGLF